LGLGCSLQSQACWSFECMLRIRKWVLWQRRTDSLSPD
jgi:hypothetical protein